MRSKQLAIVRQKVRDRGWWIRIVMQGVLFGIVGLRFESVWYWLALLFFGQASESIGKYQYKKGWDL